MACQAPVSLLGDMARTARYQGLQLAA